MLDFVPLAGARRQMADHDVEAELVGQLPRATTKPHRQGRADQLRTSWWLKRGCGAG